MNNFECALKKLEKYDKKNFDIDSVTFGLLPRFEKEEFSLPISWGPDLPDFKSIATNKYIGPLSRGMYPFEEAPVCSCKPSEGCTMYCENFQLSMECTPGKCPSMKGQVGEYCKNTVIQRAAFPRTQVFGTSECGYGLFTLEDLETDTLISEYCGEVITEKECMRRMALSSDSFYFAHLDGDLVMDAAVYGSTARFANHSCEPNCTLQKWTVNGEPRVVLVATQKISSGAELTYNYHYYQDGMDNVARKFKRQKCFCGSRICSGTIGGRVTSVHPMHERNKWVDKARILLDQIDGWGEGAGSTGAGCGAGRKNASAVVELLKSARELDSSNDKILPSESCQNTEEFQNLSEVAVRIERWEVYMQELLEGSTLLDLSEFETAARSLSPYRVRTKHDAVIAGRFEAAKRCNKMLELYKKSLQSTEEPHSSVGVQVKSERGIVSIQHGSSGSLQWPAFIKLVQALTDAIPIRCDEAASLALSSYAEYSKWCAHTFRALTLRSDLYAMDEKEGGLSLVWPPLKRLGLAYGSVLSPVPFFIEESLDRRLTAYISRQEAVARLAEEECKETVPSLGDRAGGECTDSNTDVSTDAIANVKKRKRLSVGSSEPLHCLCRMPESKCELKAFVQCDMCSEWVHLECANMPSASIGSVVKKQIELKHDVICPLCQYKSSEPLPNNFINVQSYEWHRNTFKGKPLSLSYGHLAQGLQREKALILADSPVSRLAHVALELVDSWRETAKKAIDAFPPMDKWFVAQDNAVFDTTPPTEVEVSTQYQCSQREQSASGAFSSQSCDVTGSPTSSTSFKLLLELYFTLRLLCICPEEVKVIRILLWRMSVANILCKSTSSFLLPCDCAGASTVSDHARMSIRDAKKYIRCGKALCSDSPAGRAVAIKSESIPVELSYLEESVDTLETLLSRAANCTEGVDAADIVSRMEKAMTDRGISVSGDYVYARVKALALSTSHEEICVENGSQEVGGAAAVYCWCRGADTGEPMVGCEVCSEWFHYGCIGITTRKHIKLLRETDYECIACTIKKGHAYLYQWPSAYLSPSPDAFSNKVEDSFLPPLEMAPDIVVDNTIPVE